MEVVLDLLLKLKRLGENDILYTNGRNDLGGVWTVLTWIVDELKGLNGLEDLWHVDHDLRRVVTVRQDIEQIRLSDEIESWERSSLRVHEVK